MNKKDVTGTGGGIRGILFDFDGTLTFPGALDFPAIKRQINCPQDTPILEYLDTIPPEQRTPLIEVLDQWEEEAARASVPNTGAEILIAALKERGFLLGILTRNSLKSVHIALERFKGVATDDFSAIVTRDDAIPKPHPGGVLQAAGLMGIPVSELLVVGDFRFDVISGKAAGARTALLANSERSVMAPGDPDPDYTLSGLESILEILCEEGDSA